MVPDEQRTSTFKLYKQTTEYSCGPAALSFFLSYYGLDGWDEEAMIRFLKTTEKDGTSHASITRYLRATGFPYIAGALSLQKIQLPLLVNYFDGEDGHYGVLTRMYPGTVEYFDPADGELHEMAWGRFVSSWWSPRYGKHWGLCKKLEVS